MKLLLLVCCLAAAQAETPRCAGPVIGGVHYSDEVLKSDMVKPWSPVYDPTANTVYFTELDSGSQLNKLDLNTKQFERIKDKGTHTVTMPLAVDSQTNDIYCGGENGIYKYNKTAKEVVRYGVNDSDVYDLFVKNDVIYFTIFPWLYVFTFANGKISRLEDLKDTTVRTFLIDNDDYIIYANQTGVFRRKFGSKDAVSYQYDGLVRGFALNKHGDVYAATLNGVYLVNKSKQVFEKIIEVKDCTGLTFDANNNMIYTDKTSLHWLQPSDDQSCV